MADRVDASPVLAHQSDVNGTTACPPRPAEPIEPTTMYSTNTDRELDQNASADLWTYTASITNLGNAAPQHQVEL
ncbi:hypothetical protein G7K_6453-t1 [Saitoella complicata NRRL Y-17804]|uniref:Uncharacterized protein n=1 Tax=Saitoella complicata (strain BCRC 22490 / CBS 7301 / JCM 7358 / NBRC 10748 / NRRL Y-17804) TaxID=698492 RepID=A0A0E9NSI3_SAICN|nr:hypothetical protein G7K_6453-t1 [Saitoella complicata NRRL Y-17804]